MTKQKLIIGWLYSDLMSIYGDRGNIIVLEKRCEWRDIDVEIKNIGLESSEKELLSCDLLMMGGAQDSQQTIVAKDLRAKKEALSKMIESGVPGLYICGGFQFLGKCYKEADGTVIEQLGVLDVYTENPGGQRLIGNIAIEVDSSLFIVQSLEKETTNDERITNNLIFVGFENHGGRTRLGKNVKPLGRVLKGYGSNAEDGTEGAVYKNSIGTYFHGPILPKNPELADWLICKALEKKYKKRFVISNEMRDLNEISHSARNDTIVLSPLDDSLSQKAKQSILKRIGL
ncbi:MAG TPA: cobalamin biosynthesis protein CobQ [Candidatus Eisenbacteria bacterium]|nr:cobalamin biosynthesis protein CobQ [Candidatus Eisenbacteria bacterium]